MTRPIPAAVMAAFLGAMMIAPASAQFGSIFEDLFGAPPRPPSTVPGGAPVPGGPPPGVRPQAPPPQQPSNNFPPQQGTIQSRPLPPPTAAVDPNPRIPQ